MKDLINAYFAGVFTVPVVWIMILAATEMVREFRRWWRNRP